MTYPFIKRFGNQYQKAIEPGKGNQVRKFRGFVAVKPLNSNSEFLVDSGTWDKLPWSGWKLTKTGYISGNGVQLHQVVAYLNGMLEEDPTLYIDHINRNRMDNRVCNLRPCTVIQNGWNTERKHGHQLPDGKWKFTFRKSYPTYHDAELGLINEGFDHMSENRTCYNEETFNTYDEGYQWWRFQAGIHYGEFSPFANPYRSVEQIIRESCD